MATHSEVIQDNLCSLCDKSNISLRLLDKCVEVGILTRDESAKIEKYSEYEQNRKFYDTIRRKDSESFRKLVAIMESKNTLQSNDVLVIMKNSESLLEYTPKCLKSKWWPDERNFNLINSFHERKLKDKLFVQELHDILTQNRNAMPVISQKVAVSGLGGVGKTTTAKWYANYYKGFYDHIIWLDCGEGCLLKTFQDLARELDIKNRHELDSRTLARDSCAALEKFKCLWIFDNAECYIGNEGIRDLLPRNRNFHTIITSRNQDWGNDNGHGTISQFLLEVFDIEESISFMKTNLQDKSFHDEDLRQLCHLLGNLPLALQIATAAMNRQKLKLTEYVERVKNTDRIIFKKFDDYEKTINATLKMSLEFIKDHDNDSDQLAYQILLTYGYIQPDNVEIGFFERVEKSKTWEIQDAMDLLEMYSLISKRENWIFKSSGEKVEMIYHSIHRLLQQVIRHNGRNTERGTIRKILNCEGFLNYKLVPFTFADEELKCEFARIRAQLVDQNELTKLIRKGKFTDALQLSEIIKNTMKSSASDFNYAICLKNKSEFKAALAIFSDIDNAVPNLGVGALHYSCEIAPTELVQLSLEPLKVFVGSQLFIIHLLERSFKMADEVLRRDRIACVRNSDDSLYCILDALRSNKIVSVPTPYLLTIYEQTICISLENQIQRSIVFQDCQVDTALCLPERLERLELRGVSLKVVNHNKQFEIVDLSDFIPPSVIELDIDSQPFLPRGRILINAMVTLERLTSIGKIRLSNCKIKLSDKPIQICPTDLQFQNVRFVQNETTQVGKEMFLNEVINFHRVKNIRITADYSNVPAYEYIDREKVDELTVAPISNFQELYLK